MSKQCPHCVEEEYLGAWRTSTTATIEASEWVVDLCERLWTQGDNPEASLLRRIMGKISPTIFSCLYYYKKMNLSISDPSFGSRFLLNDMNMVVFEFMSHSLTQFERANKYIGGPRESGKTLVSVEVAPVWGALPSIEDNVDGMGLCDEAQRRLMYQFAPYSIVISDTEEQSKKHLQKIYEFLVGEECMIQYDWPDMCTPSSKGLSSQKKAASAKAIEFRSNMRLEAYGSGSGILGIRHGDLRPSYAILDDIEPAASWSMELAEERRVWIEDAVKPLSRILRLLCIATPQTPGSIAHQLVQYARGELEIATAPWVEEWKPTVIEAWKKIRKPEDRDSEEEPEEYESVDTFWPGFITPTRLEEEELKPTWGVSYACRPGSDDMIWWQGFEFTRRSLDDQQVKWITVYVDPKKKERTRGRRASWAAWAFAVWVFDGPVWIVGGGYSLQVGRGLCRDVMNSMEASGFHFDELRYEDNAVGDSLTHDFRAEGLTEEFGLEAIEFSEKIDKEKRAFSLFSAYQAIRVVHYPINCESVERGLMIYKGGKLSSDMVDAVGGGVRRVSEVRRKGVYGTKRHKRRKNYGGQVSSRQALKLR